MFKIKHLFPIVGHDIYYFNIVRRRQVDLIMGVIRLSINGIDSVDESVSIKTWIGLFKMLCRLSRL